MNDMKILLEGVQRPGRYVGGETNSVRKNFKKGRTSVVLAYPDTYEVGMSYLGLRVLYHLLNERDDCLCERVFAPWDDMEKQLNIYDQKLFSLESKTAINKFDILGFSLSYELTYTNVLNMLSMGGVSVLSRERKEGEPLVIAGGACCYNPEPMSDFIDVFIIGDGEEALPAVIDEYALQKGRRRTRKAILKALTKIQGVYVPSLYNAEYSGGKFLMIKPVEDGVPPVVKKALVKDFENAYYPEKQMVPFLKTVHDRIAVEVMRGCPNKCRFCQASVINSPVRVRTPDRIRKICSETYKHTGYERIALLSLSSVNYPHLPELLKALNKDFAGKGVGVSIPSLKVDESFYELPEIISATRKAGLTFAPETASDTLRESLGKNIDLNVLCKSASMAYRYGWRSLKLYFMVGFPGEAEEEIDRIIQLARKLSRLKKEISGGAAEIKVSVNPFVPKAHTPLQWIGMKEERELLRIKSLLKLNSSRKIKVDFNNVPQALLEACMSRGDRRLGNVIYTAWKKGARMDSWRDFFDFRVWEESFSLNNMDIRNCAAQTYSLDDALPWSHIRSAVDEDRLKQDLKASGLYQ